MGISALRDVLGRSGSVPVVKGASLAAPSAAAKEVSRLQRSHAVWTAQDPSATSYLYHRDAWGCGTGYLWLLLYEQLQVARQLLEVQARRSDTGDFVQRSPRENVQCKILAGADYDEPCTAEILARAKDNLRYFSVVGFTERFEQSLALMKLPFGWKLSSYSSVTLAIMLPAPGRRSAICRNRLSI
jgi:hypothetical protein